jgi:large subunit ribosomal protein L15
MQFHQIKRMTPRKLARQIGRGGKRGKTSGRGGKGQTARAGAKVRPELRDFIKRLPKLRGRGKNLFRSFKEDSVVINLSALADFKSGEVVSPSALLEKGLIKKKGGRVPRVKILGGGELPFALKFQDLVMSKSAAEKVKKAGGFIQPPRSTTEAL